MVQVPEQTSKVFSLKYRGVWGVAICVLSLGAAHAAFAHTLNYGAMRTNLTVEGNRIYLVTNVPQSISLGSYYEKETKEELFTEAFSSDFQISEEGRWCAFTLTSLDDVDGASHSSYEGYYTCSNPVLAIDELAIHNDIFATSFVTYDHFVTLTLNYSRWTLLFNNKAVEYPRDVRATLATGFWGRAAAIAKDFLWLGMTHIWTGYDHILFLLLVVLLVRSFRKILVLVTAFTISHSLTLLLAASRLITLSSHIVEPLIAATIVYMAIRNVRVLQRSDTHEGMAEQWFVIFGFGLVHGLGFASALMETSIPSDFFLPAIVLFNIGIEIGQLALIALFLPILFMLDRSPYRFKLYIAISSIAGLLAAYWFFMRVFFA